jgi:hypothetical protein
MGILNQERFNLLITDPSPYHLASYLLILHQANIFTLENQHVIMRESGKPFLAPSLNVLAQEGILTQEYFDILVAHENPYSIALTLKNLHQLGILTHQNRTIFLGHPQVYSLSFVCRILYDAQLLDQVHFNQLVAAEHAALLSDGARTVFWDRLVPHHLAANWERILVASRSALPLRALEDLTNQILGIGQAFSGFFNPTQSIHTSSVHRTVAKSATNLMRAYGHLNLETTIEAMGAELANLDDAHLKHRAAKRAFSRLVAADYTFVESVSGVSTRQLLALVYLGLHDDRKRLGLIADAKRFWIESLYEVQRGYNLNESGVDDGALEDKPICVAGTFNKLLEALNGIHVDVEIFYLSKQSASAKFQKLAQQEALRFLKSLAPEQRQERIQKLKEHATLEPIWKDIEGRVRDEFWVEFKTIYNENEQDQDFLVLMQQWVYCQLPDLKLLEPEFKQSHILKYSVFAAAVGGSIMPVMGLVAPGALQATIAYMGIASLHSILSCIIVSLIFALLSAVLFFVIHQISVAITSLDREGSRYITK